MKAMQLRGISSFTENPAPLSYVDVPDPIPAEGEVLIRVRRCGVCHTELDEIEGRTPPAHLPVIPGHQVVGIIEHGKGKGQRVGAAWIASTCGKCEYCISGRENLCPEFMATGRDLNGGYAEFIKIRADFVHPIPPTLSDSETAPLLCAGAIGYRSLKLSGIADGQSLGLMGFGGSNHLVLKIATNTLPRSRIFVFSRNKEEQEFAISLGAAWAGPINKASPERLDAIIDTTPVWGPILEALKNLRSGGRLIINAIRKEEVDKQLLMRMDYPSQLWQEKEIKSVANVTRQDVREFLQIAGAAHIKPEYQEFELKDANLALAEMKQGKIHGSKVLVI